MDTLPLRVIEKYRYRTSASSEGSAIKRKINQTDGEAESPKQPKRFKHVYLLNKAKYWAEVSAADLRAPVDVANLDDKSHSILQHRIRK